MKTDESFGPSRLAMLAAGAIVLGLTIHKAFFLLAAGAGVIALSENVFHEAQKRVPHRQRPRTAH